jgi:hypothetical protein
MVRGLSAGGRWIRTIGPAVKETAWRSGPRPTIVVSRDDLCLMTRVQLIGPAGNSRETPFAKSGTDGSNPVPSTKESERTRSSPRMALGWHGPTTGPCNARERARPIRQVGEVGAP